MILVIYKSYLDGKKYKFDITNYLDSHPGEGIRNIYLRNYKNKLINKEMEKYHFTDEPFDILEKIIKGTKHPLIKLVN